MSLVLRTHLQLFIQTKTEKGRIVDFAINAKVIVYYKQYIFNMLYLLTHLIKRLFEISRYYYFQLPSTINLTRISNRVYQLSMYEINFIASSNI